MPACWNTRRASATAAWPSQQPIRRGGVCCASGSSARAICALGTTALGAWISSRAGAAASSLQQPAAPAHRLRPAHRRRSSSGAAGAGRLRQQRLQPLQRLGLQRAQPHAGALPRHRRPSPRRRCCCSGSLSCSLRLAAKARQRLGRQEHLLQRAHAQHAGARDGRVVDTVGIGRLARRARPERTTITGLLRAAARAADRNLRGDAIVSMYSRIERVRASLARWSSMSPASTSACWPSDTTCEKPMPRARAQSSMALTSEPDCETKASSPGSGVGVRRCWRSSPMCGASMPMQPGPRTRSRCGRAASSMAWRCARVQAAAQAPPPRACRVRPSSATTPGTLAAGVQITRQVGGPAGKSAMRA